MMTKAGHMKNVRMAGLEVSKLCFGTLTLGPLQKGMSVEEGAELMVYAVSRGINFFDTAELYGTYPHLKAALRKVTPVISTKSYAYDTEGARQSVERARREMDLDVIDVFMMHEQETRLTLEGHREALEFYLEQKARGVIRAVGVSTHALEVVHACADMPEIDIIHPLVNIAGLGIIDADLSATVSGGLSPADQMLQAISHAKHKGKGIFSMKPLGGGNLAKTYDECMAFVLGNENIHSIAVGMQTRDEIDMNVAAFESFGEGSSMGAAPAGAGPNFAKPSQILVPADLRGRCARDDKYLHVADWCTGCGSCVGACQFGALTLANSANSGAGAISGAGAGVAAGGDYGAGVAAVAQPRTPLGHPIVNKARCVTCGYCSRRCPVFALKIY